jgi:putative sterol carrier protein
MSIETEPLTADAGSPLEQLFRDFETHGAPSATSESSYLFQLTGEGGGNHLLRLGPGWASWQHDYDGAADVTVTMEANDVLAVINGQLDGRLAFASERIEIEGDLELARKMVDLVTAQEEVPEDDEDEVLLDVAEDVAEDVAGEEEPQDESEDATAEASSETDTES